MIAGGPGASPPGTLPALADGAAAVPLPVAPGVTAAVLLDVAGAAGGRMVRRLLALEAGAVLAGTAGLAGELWYVTSGLGTLRCRGTEAGQPVPAGHGIALPPGADYELTAAPDLRHGPLRVDAVTLPGGADPAEQVLVRELAACDVEVTGDRSFRVLFGPQTGYPAATQFCGVIPPGRAPDHRHAYDEVVLVIDGAGIAHLVADSPSGSVRVLVDGVETVRLGEATFPLCAGSALHLPPGQRHCLENASDADLVVLGVFHPGGTPAAKQPAA